MEKTRKRGRPKGHAKDVVYCRIDPATIKALDEICASMRPVPSRAQLIDLALADFVERLRKPDRRPKAAID